MVKSAFFGLLVAGLCAVPVFADDDVHVHSHSTFPVIEGDLSNQMWKNDASLGRDADEVAEARREWEVHHDADHGPRVMGRSETVHSQSEIRSSDGDVRTADASIVPGEIADRNGPVPFADLGKVGDGDSTLKTPEAIEQDKRLLVKGEVRGDDVILRLPAGTKHDTISLRSSAGLDIRHKELMKMARFDGDDLIISRSALERHGSFDLNNLWVWGTGPESASLLQRVAMGDIPAREVASTEVRDESLDTAEVRSDATLRTETASTSLSSENRVYGAPIAPIQEERADLRADDDIKVEERDSTLIEDRDASLRVDSDLRTDVDVDADND